MEWTEDHDVLLLREILASDLFSFRKGSVAKGVRWESIAETQRLVEFMQEKAKTERELQQQELDLRRLEQ